MEDLEFIGVEDGRLVLETPDGTRYALAVDDRVRSATRRGEPVPTGAARNLSPRDIQAHIRGGMTAEEVVRVTGAPLEYVQRFEGPVVAEREYVITSALHVPVHTAVADPLATPSTFGRAIVERLHIIGGTDERWSSWKDENGWVVRLGFDLGVVEHDARWQFDPKRQSLSPINAEAVGLSRVDASETIAVPRLRAVPNESELAARATDRFDSGAFQTSLVDSGPVLSPLGHRPSKPVEETTNHSQTADLLEALRRRRGEREAAAIDDLDEAPHTAGSIRLVELDFETAPAPTQPMPRATTGPLGSRKKPGRPALPSWDEIVFGARSDEFGDDLA